MKCALDKVIIGRSWELDDVELVKMGVYKKGMDGSIGLVVGLLHMTSASLLSGGVKR